MKGLENKMENWIKIEKHSEWTERMKVTREK